MDFHGPSREFLSLASLRARCLLRRNGCECDRRNERLCEGVRSVVRPGGSSVLRNAAATRRELQVSGLEFSRPMFAAAMLERLSLFLDRAALRDRELTRA